MGTVYKSRNEIPTIDCELITIETVVTPASGNDPAVTREFGFTTANKLGVEPQIETTDAVKLMIKGKLKAQKKEESTITGHQLTLTDNVFNPELVKILQGGTVKYWTSDAHTTSSETPSAYGVSQYTPPIVGSNDNGEVFKLNAYSAQYNAAGQIVNYEKIAYPNCTGVPIAFGAEDGVFRAPEYTINSAPDNGEAPYDITYVDALPTLTDPT